MFVQLIQTQGVLKSNRELRANTSSGGDACVGIQRCCRSREVTELQMLKAERFRECMNSRYTSFAFFCLKPLIASTDHESKAKCPERHQEIYSKQRWATSKQWRLRAEHVVLHAGQRRFRQEVAREEPYSLRLDLLQLHCIPANIADRRITRDPGRLSRNPRLRKRTQTTSR